MYIDMITCNPYSCRFEGRKNNAFTAILAPNYFGTRKHESIQSCTYTDTTREPKAETDADHKRVSPAQSHIPCFKAPHLAAATDNTE